MLPLINNESNPLYNGVTVKLGETIEHYNQRPTLSKIGRKQILGICIGASTPGQISAAIEARSGTLNNVRLINTCSGGQDINDWLNLSSKGWTNLNKILTQKKAQKEDVQFVIMCHDDLRTNDTTFPNSPISLANKMADFVKLAKQQLPNLKIITMMSRLCDYKITDPKFVSPSGYYNGFADKFLVEKAIAQGGYLNGVWITDADFYLFTDGENVRSDGFKFYYSWMKQNGTNIHMDTSKGGDEACADYGLANCRARYEWFN